IGGAELTGARVRVTESKTVGLVANGAGTRVTLSQLQVSDVTLPPCPGHPRCDDLQPTGVLVMDGAAMKLDQFLVTRNTGIGVQIATGGQLDLSDGEISEHLIGANLDADYDLARLSDRVRYVNTTTKLGAMRAPLPSVQT